MDAVGHLRRDKFGRLPGLPVAEPLGRYATATLAPLPSKGCRIAPTCTCVQTPPRAVRTLRSLSLAAMALWLVAPARMISSMMGRTLAAASHSASQRPCRALRPQLGLDCPRPARASLRPSGRPWCALRSSPARAEPRRRGYGPSTCWRADCPPLRIPRHSPSRWR
jgi:hypothetical protein